MARTIFPAARQQMPTSDFVRDAAIQAHDEKLAYIAVHNHDGLNRVGFSLVDMASHERGYPALRQLTGQIVGGLVLTPHAAAGDLLAHRRHPHHPRGGDYPRRQPPPVASLPGLRRRA